MFHHKTITQMISNRSQRTLNQVLGSHLRTSALAGIHFYPRPCVLPIIMGTKSTSIEPFILWIFLLETREVHKTPYYGTIKCLYYKKLLKANTLRLGIFGRRTLMPDTANLATCSWLVRSCVPEENGLLPLSSVIIISNCILNIECVQLSPLMKGATFLQLTKTIKNLQLIKIQRIKKKSCGQARCCDPHL